MVPVLLVHLVAALAAPRLLSRWGRRAFPALALAPGSAALWALASASDVLAGRGPSIRYRWIPQLGVEIAFQLDPLSWLMVVIVGGVGALVLAYCARYFAPRSSGLGRFGAILVAFAGAMLGLVTSTNLIQLFVFWELTTVFSYLLIGHYSDRGSSRRAAMKAILVTTLGGLAMLVGILILGTEAGTYHLPDILAAPPTGTAITVAIVLILAGVVSKSALLPFHFWLPAAMAAPTPVSAYLHAAAMVKAGVYLVARLAPAYALDPVWQGIVVVLGGGSFLVGGFQALRQHDLKLLLAFGTVSQLGLLVLLVGSPNRATALGGLALLGAHAMFKSSLFLTVGVIDATTGTRDIRRLSGLGRMMPVTATIGALATASMIGLVPFAGYVAKEAALGSLLEPEGPMTTWSGLMLACFVVGSVLTVAYGLRFWWGAFGTKRAQHRYPVAVGGPPWFLITPPALPALAGLGAALLPFLGERLFAPHTNTYPVGEAGHLAVFEGLTPAFWITLGVLVGGAALAVASERLSGRELGLLRGWDADRIYRHTLRRIDLTATNLTSVVQRGSLPLYLGVILVVVIVSAGAALIRGTRLPDSLGWNFRVAQVGVTALIAVAALLAARARRRLKAVILAGVTGYGSAILFLLYGAPDLALTQVLVETVTLVMFVLVLRRLPAYFSNRPLANVRWVRLAIGVLTGVLVAGLAVIIPQYRLHDPISRLFPKEAVGYGGGYNIVNVALVDIRAWDTIGEISVLMAAATGIASLIFVSHRGRGPSDLTDLAQKAGIIGASDPDPMALLRTRPRRTARPRRSTRRQWLVGGVTLAPQRRSVIFEVATRIVYHTMVVFALFLLFSGHNAPGGGFVAGLVIGIALAVRYLAGGRYELSAAAPLQPGVMLGTGLVVAAGSGLAAMLFGGEVLQSAVLEGILPGFGHVKIVTSTLFDVGVFLVVVGLMLDVLRSLGAEIDRHGESSGHDSDLVRPALEPADPIRRNLP